jgi:hypothetical protein
MAAGEIQIHHHQASQAMNEIRNCGVLLHNDASVHYACRKFSPFIGWMEVG